MFPGDFPDHINDLIQQDILKMLPAKSIIEETVYREAANRAVDVIEHVFPAYRKEHEELFNFVSETLKSPMAENGFKKSLCNRLAEFYSANILLNGLEKYFGSEPVLIYPYMNVRSYLHIEKLLAESNQQFFKHPHCFFPGQSNIDSFIDNLKEYLLVMSRLSAQAVASGIGRAFRPGRKKKKSSYYCGVAIIAPARQLADNQRGPDFIIDNDKIKTDDIVYLPFADLTDSQKGQLNSLPGEVYYPPKPGGLFSHFSQWGRLLWLAVKKSPMRNAAEVDMACKIFFNYFSCLKMLEEIDIRHFITHCDYGAARIGRNLALNQAGIQTWYFTDSMNLGCAYETKDVAVKHPFWTYLYYDNLITWSAFIEKFFKSHPGAFKKTHVTGCLWSGHIIASGKTEKKKLKNIYKDADGLFILSAFDSTYAMNALGSYREGIAFAKDLLRLADAFPDIYILLKEKKTRDIHRKLDYVLGPGLLKLYEEMDVHPRIKTYSDRVDASELISASDMVVSFPFTSTTFEALSANKPAIWHDPLGYNMDSAYAKAGGITTHSYDEMKSKLQEIKALEHGVYHNHLPVDSPLMDPCRDGKAIDRFRDLLNSRDVHIN